MNFDEIEEHRESTAGLEHEQDQYALAMEWENEVGLDPDRLDEIAAYTMDDPKHSDYYGWAVNLWDNREGK